jgi:hypothetical protein
MLSCVPHCPQNRIPLGLPKLHFGQRMSPSSVVMQVVVAEYTQLFSSSLQHAGIQPRADPETGFGYEIFEQRLDG